VAAATRELVDPAATRRARVEHFSIPAFDAGCIPEVVAPSTIKSSKFAVDQPSVLVSRLNPRTPRVWFAVPSAGTGLASTEFLVLRGLAGVSLGAVWLAVRSQWFLEELRRRATGTSGSHQRVRPGDAMSIEVPDVRAAPPQLIGEADALIAVIQHAQTEARTLAVLRDALLPEFLSGRRRVPEARERVEVVT
jgi:type I restriction enzyme S subunit